MSTLSNLSNYSLDYPIGEVVNVLVGDANSEAVGLLQSNGFIECGAIYNKVDYPELYSKLGNINATRFNTTLGLVYNGGIAYNSPYYVNVGGATGALKTSTDLITWTGRTSNTSSVLNDVTYGNGLFVAVGGGGAVVSSTDAITWTARTSGTTTSLTRVVHNGSEFLAMGGTGFFTASTDAVTWVVRIGSAAIASPNTLLYNPSAGLYVASGQGIVKSSTNAITWNTAYSPGSVIVGMAYGAGIYAVVINNYDIAYSTDLINWTYKSAVAGTLGTIYAIGYTAKYNLFVISTANGTFTSPDGNTWTLRPSLYGITSTRIYEYKDELLLQYSTTLYKSKNITSYSEAPGYNTDTQFYIPVHTFGTSPLAATGWGATRTGATWQSYIRAK